MEHDQTATGRMRRVKPMAAAMLPLVVAIVTGGCEMPRLPTLPSLPDVPGMPGIYRIDIRQGNVIDSETLDRIEIGMERRKVRFILGTPLLVDPFNQDRWDYFHSLRQGSGEEATQRVTLHFADDRLARIERRLQTEGTADAPVERTRTLVKVPQSRRNQGLLERLLPGSPGGEDDGSSSE